MFVTKCHVLKKNDFVNFGMNNEMSVTKYHVLKKM